MKFLIVIQKVFGFIHEGFNLLAKSFGFHDFDSMGSYIFVISNKFTTGVVLAFSLVVGVNGWIDTWVFSPPYTYYVFIGLMLAEIILGTIKAIWIDKEAFNFDKAARIIPKFIGHTFALSSSFHLAQVEVLLGWMPSSVFIFFGVQNFLKGCMHFVALKGLEGDFIEFMKKKFAQNNDFIPTINKNQKDENQRQRDSDPS